jgi:hypothetical protein
MCKQLSTLVLMPCAVLLLAACGGPDSTPVPAANLSETGSDAKAASATYLKFFEDVGNAASGAKWSISNSSGAKQFALSNTYYSSPKAWVIGQNYWNGENDKLTSVPITIPPFRAGIKLSFYSRWQIALGDYARVDYSTDNGGNWTQLQAFTNGSNAAWPNWTKYTYALPDNMTASAQTWRIRFRFTSNSSGTGWGFGTDSISVYQRELEAPTGVAAGDNTSGPIDITWDAPADALGPEFYQVFYATNPDGPYNQGGSFDPQGSGSYDAADSTVYWFKVRAVKSGYSPGPFSNIDSGYEH